MSRRLELKECLLQQIENALRILTEILNSILYKYKRVANTVTPPPSPNHQSPYQSPYHSPSHSPCHRMPTPSSCHRISTSSSAQLINSHLQKHDINPLQPLDAQSEELCINVFNCLTSYISWLPLSRVFTPTLVTKIFNFAEYGCSVIDNSNGNTGSRVGMLRLHVWF